MSERSDILKPLCDTWIGVVDQCVKSKAGFTEVAALCRKFFCGLSGFMWESEYRQKYMGKANIATPKFKVTINKSFELVAIVGPSLYWQYPHRTVRAYDPLPLTPDIIGDPNDPFVQQMWQVVSAEMARDKRIADMRNATMEQYLNYAQREQPGGGLEIHSQLGITEALITGRGCLWTEAYRFPGSENTLTGSFFDSTNDLLIDPDCTDPTLETALFVIRRHRHAHWDVEKKFGLKPNSLRGKASTYESGTAKGVNRSRNETATERRNGIANDMVEWFEIFSKCGVGTRLHTTNRFFPEDVGDLAGKFDDVVGDYARICVARGVDYPLNAPPDRFLKASDEDVQSMFDWPIPFWKDNRWPVSVLDFYKDTDGCWPIAPIAPGLGELICINVLASVLTSQTYDNSRQVVAYLGSAAQAVEAALRGTDSPAMVKLNETTNKSIADCIQFLQKPEINMDVWKTIDWLSTVFDKRTGLSELLYAMNPGGAQSRSAEDAKIKQSMASVRPEYMAKQVAKWQTSAAEAEKIAAGWKLKSRDIVNTLGPAGSMVWEKFIENEDPERVFREMRCTVEADDVKKPNIERDQSNMLQLAGQFLAVLDGHANVTGDTGPLNALIGKVTESLQVDGVELAMGDRVPMPPDPQIMEMQQQQMRLEMSKLQADAEKSQMDAQAKAIDAQVKQDQAAQQAAQAEQQMAIDAQSKQMELQFEAAKGEQQMQLDREKAGLQLEVEAAKAKQQLQLQQIQGQQQVAMGQQKMEMQAEQHQQNQAMRGMEFASNLTQARMNHAQQMSQSREKAKSDMAAKKSKKKPGAK